MEMFGQFVRSASTWANGAKKASCRAQMLEGVPVARWQAARFVTSSAVGDLPATALPEEVPEQVMESRWISRTQQTADLADGFINRATDCLIFFVRRLLA